MNFLLFQLQRLLMLPARLITSPLEVFSAFSDGSARNEAFLKGLPALLVASVGTLAVLVTSLGGQQSLVDFYDSQLQKTDNRRKIVQSELQQSLINQSAGALGSDVASLQKLKDEDPRTKEIERLSQEAEIYLNKLIKLQPDQREYKFRLATRAYVENDLRRCLEIMKQIAPLDAPGYPEAHLSLAKLLQSAPTNSKIQRISNLDTALTHIEHCLTNDLNNLDALKIKANLLNQKGSRVEARNTFKKVFDQDPRYFIPLIQLQSSDEEKKATLLAAAAAFSQQLNSTDVQKDSKRWVAAWEGYAESTRQLGDYAEVEDRLLGEIDRYKDDTENITRLPFLKSYLAKLYFSWCLVEIGSPLQKDLLEFSEADQLKMLDFFSKAYSYDENERTVLQSLARLSFSQFKNISQKARQIYDPETQSNLPPEVLNQMGLEALKSRDYKLAQRYYERARAISPNSSAMLNNLAYAYLKGEDEGDFSESELLRKRKSNAERAHDLVAQAMRLLPQSELNSPNMSRYRHTLGTALMQLKNYAAAVAEFEQALAIRPNNVELLQSLIVCYDNYNLDSTPYRNKLERVLADRK